MIQKKTLVNITACMIVICAFWNIIFGSFKESKTATDKTTSNVNVVKEETVKTESNKATVSKQTETVTITEDSFDKQSTSSEITSDEQKAEVINTSTSCSSNYSSSRFGERGGINVIKCNCKMVKSDGVVYETSQKIIQTFNHEPKPGETDCNKTCNKVCDNFLNDFK